MTQEDTLMVRRRVSAVSNHRGLAAKSGPLPFETLAESIIRPRFARTERVFVACERVAAQR